MTNKEELEKLKKLADAMYYAAQHLTTDASRLHKAMNEYHQFIINEYHKEESINYNKLKAMLDDALAKETKESWNERLGITQEEHDAIVDKCLYGKEPELVDVDDLPKEEPVSEDLEEAANNFLTEFYGVGEPHNPTDIGFFKAGAKWQKEQFEKDYTNLCNGIATAKGLSVAMAYDRGMADAKEQLMASGTDVTVHIEAGNYPYIPQIELYDYDKDIPLAKEGDKYKVILIKEK